MRERDVSAYLNAEVEKLGGEIRRVQWIGRNNAPDKLVLLDGASGWVEEKRTGKDAEAAQKREHDRLRKAGLFVRVVDSRADVDMFLRILFRKAKAAQAEAKGVTYEW
jgi:hypothetical protein